MSTSIDQLRLEVAALRARTAPLCPGLAEEYQNAQQKADAAWRAVGCSDGAPQHLAGEDLVSYRQRLLAGVQSRSQTWRGVHLPRSQDALAPIEQQILTEATNSLTDPGNYKPGELRAIVSLDQTGRKITRFYGDPGVTWSPFQPATIRCVTGFSGGGK